MQLVASVDACRRARPARRPRHRLRRPRQPRAGPPAARRGRPVALRHDGRPLRGRRAVGAAPPGAERGTSVAVVLDRVRRGVDRVIRDHLASMLTEQASAPLAALHRAGVDARGRRPAAARRRAPGCRLALGAGQDARARALVVRQTLTGALDSLDPRRSQSLVDASAAQSAREGAREAAPTPYAAARRGVDRDCATARCCGARCSPAGRSSSAPASSSAGRATVSGSATGRRRVQGEPAPPPSCGEALHSGRGGADRRAEGPRAATTRGRWRALAGGRSLLARRTPI